jgi:hypothetical protein
MPEEILARPFGQMSLDNLSQEFEITGTQTEISKQICQRT